MFKAIRSDESVGFVNKIHQDYFRKFDQLIEAGWDEDDADLYEHMLHPDFQWYKLQYRDPEIIETADMRR
jgi:CDP-glycerol glycerophosphotransferase (TagB/SpsB family)